MRPILVAALAVAAFGAGIAASSPAEARRGYYSWTSEHAGPVRGYSGFAGFGARRYYCDYQRHPNRECTVSGGKKRCRIVSWTLRQHCY
mgnify:CR=1 FL=1